MFTLHTFDRGRIRLFRCNGCQVAFRPTPREINHCPRCTAGRELHAAILGFQRAFKDEAR